jgi:hypothetical protein
MVDMKELEPTPSDPIEYLENETQPEEVNPRLTKRDGNYVTAEEAKSEAEKDKVHGSASLAASLAGLELAYKGEGLLRKVGILGFAACVAYGSKKASDFNQDTNEFYRDFEVDYDEA